MYKSVHCDMSKIKTSSTNKLLSLSTALMCDAALAAGVNATTSMLASLILCFVCIFRSEKLQGDPQRIK